MNPTAFWRLVDTVGCHTLGRFFVGGHGVSEILWMGQMFKENSFEVTYNLLGEHVVNHGVVDASLLTTTELIYKMRPENRGNISCKPTLYGLCISKELCRENLRLIADAARSRGIELEIDAENHDHIRDTFEISSSLIQAGYNEIIRQAVQAHLKDIVALMEEYNLYSKKLRIVKGAGVYDEDSSIVEQDEAVVIERYLEILVRNIKNGQVPFAATMRDRNLAARVMKLAEKDEVEFQMLFGLLGGKLSAFLSKAGYRKRIYLPFVDTWCKDVWKPYGMRRAQMMRKKFFGNFIG